jgi:hypothetical protein
MEVGLIEINLNSAFSTGGGGAFEGTSTQLMQKSPLSRKTNANKEEFLINNIGVVSFCYC